MSDNTSLVNLGNIGELTKPATVLIERGCDAVGGLLKPWQIRRVTKAGAEAEAEAAKLRLLSQIELTEISQRALHRFAMEETIKQANMESILSKAIVLLDEDAKPQDIENDWIANFFDKCRLISDNEMQELWAKILAGEANSPGGYAKRTVNTLSSLDKSDANLFESLCGFCCFAGDVIPLIYEPNASIYTDHGVSFNSLIHLDTIGLIKFDAAGAFRRTGLPKNIRISYFGTLIELEFDKEMDNELHSGKVLLSQIGQQLARVSGAQPVPEFMEYLAQTWARQRVSTSLPVTQPS
jgi:hypothetical protein